eukprot:scaffold11302_cov57-Phaeocystis_antarctica.AAC.2
MEGTCMCSARLPHRFLRGPCCLIVRVEKLLGDLEHAELLVPSEDDVVLQRRETRTYVRRCEEMTDVERRDLEMRQDGPCARGGPTWAGEARERERSALIRRRRACSVVLWLAFFAATGLKLCS